MKSHLPRSPKTDQCSHARSRSQAKIQVMLTGRETTADTPQLMSGDATLVSKPSEDERKEIGRLNFQVH